MCEKEREISGVVGNISCLEEMKPTAVEAGRLCCPRRHRGLTKSEHARPVQYRARKQAAVSSVSRLLTRAVLYRCPNGAWFDLDVRINEARFDTNLAFQFRPPLIIRVIQGSRVITSRIILIIILVLSSLMLRLSAADASSASRAANALFKGIGEKKSENGSHGGNIFACA